MSEEVYPQNHASCVHGGWVIVSAKYLFMYLLEKYLYRTTHVSTSHSDKNYIPDYVRYKNVSEVP